MIHNQTSSSTFEERKKQEDKDFHSIIAFFERSGFSIADVHENKKYFHDDIDIVVFQWEHQVSIEIKFDDYLDKYTNNFFFEIISNERLSSPGCFLLSKAEIRVYYSKHTKIWYIFPLKKLQNRFFEIRNNFKDPKEIDNICKLKSTHTKYNDGKYKHTTIWRIIDKDIVLKWCKKYKIKYLTKKIAVENITLYEINELLKNE